MNQASNWTDQFRMNIFINQDEHKSTEKALCLLQHYDHADQDHVEVLVKIQKSDHQNWYANQGNR